MGQVPSCAIIGDGRMARHFAHYLSLLERPYQPWSRSQNTSLSDVIQNCSSVLLLISDLAIEPFIKAHPCLSGKRLIHFSGRLVTDLAYGVHPLMTFSRELYPLEAYKKIPWVLEKEGPAFSDLLPGLSNPYFYIPKEEKDYYHALCVMANNFTTILWSKFFNTMDERFQIPKENLLPYLQRTLMNLSQDHDVVLTGPLARGDQSTIDANLTSLKNDSFQSVYKAFVDVFEAGISGHGIGRDATKRSGDLDPTLKPQDDESV